MGIDGCCKWVLPVGCRVLLVNTGTCWLDARTFPACRPLAAAPVAPLPQVLLKGRALEALVEGTCARGSVAGEARPLAQLLSAVAHPTAPAGFAAALAEAAAALGAVSAADPLTPVPEARRATRAALTLLKRGLPKPAATKAVEAPAATLRRLGGELGRAEARLGATTQPKELAKLYSSILDLLCGQLDVLRPGGGAPPPPQAPELAAALRALEELRAALATRLQVGPGLVAAGAAVRLAAVPHVVVAAADLFQSFALLCCSNPPYLCPPPFPPQEVLAPKPKLSVEQQVAQAEAAHKKEEAATSVSSPLSLPEGCWGCHRGLRRGLAALRAWLVVGADCHVCRAGLLFGGCPTL